MAQVLIHGLVDVGFHEPDRTVAECEIGSVAIVRAAKPADECRTHREQARVDALLDILGVGLVAW